MSTFIQFSQLSFADPFVFSAAGAATSISASVPVFVTFDPLFCLVPGCGGVTPGVFSLSFAASSTGPASLVNGGQDIVQGFAGSLSLTQPGVNLLSILFSDQLTGSVGGSSPTLAASQPPDTFSGTSTVLDPALLGIPRGFALSFSDFAPGLAITGGTVRSGTADATGTFSASPAAVVPEPASLLLLCLGLCFTAKLLRRMRSA